MDDICQKVAKLDFNISIRLFLQVPTLHYKQTRLIKYNLYLGFDRLCATDFLVLREIVCVATILWKPLAQFVDLCHSAYFTSRRCKVRWADESRRDGRKTKFSPSAEILKSKPLDRWDATVKDSVVVGLSVDLCCTAVYKKSTGAINVFDTTINTFG